MAAWAPKSITDGEQTGANIWGHLEAHLGLLESPFGFVLPLLVRFLALFWLSWVVLGRLRATFSPKLAQVGPSWPKIPKKTSIFGFNFRKLAQVGTQKSKKIYVKNDVFFGCVFDIDFFRFLMDFGLRKPLSFSSNFELKTKTSIS